MRPLIITLLLAISLSTAQATPVSGTVSVDTHWTLGGSPYNLVGIFGVDAGATLTIDPGVQVTGNFDLVVLGQIIIDGDNGNTVGFQNTRLILRKVNLSLSAIEYVDFNNAGVQLAGDTGSSTDDPKNYGTLLLKNCTFTNNAYAYAKGYNESENHGKLRIENSTFSNSPIKGFLRAEFIELDHVTISNTAITSDIYHHGIKISNSTITNTQLQMGCCGANLDISNSTLTSSSIVDGSGNPVNGLLNLAGTTLTDTYIYLPAAKLTMLNCDVNFSLSRGYVIEMGNGALKNSTIKATPGQNLIRLSGYQGYDLLGSATFDKVDFKDCSTAVEITDLGVSRSASFFHCNFFNPSQYAINNQSARNIDAKSNYWGTSTDATIQGLIFDHFDNINKGVVDYADFLLSKALFTPVIAWNNPTAIDYGNALNATQLDASADVAGTLTYTPPIGTTLNAGANQPLSVSFVPTDPANYYPVTKQVNLTVNKLDQIMSFGTIASRSFGDASFPLTASSNSGLTVAFSSVSDKIQITGSQLAILKPGRATVSATQPGNVNYNSATVSQSFCIAPAKPTVTIANPNSLPLLTSSAATGNQWYANDAAIGGAIAQNYLVTLSGNYKLQVTADDCASPFSDVLAFSITGDLHPSQILTVSPVPAVDFLEILGLTEYARTATIMTMTGQSIPVLIEKSGAGDRINTEGLSTGLYILNVQDERSVHRIRFAVR